MKILSQLQWTWTVLQDRRWMVSIFSVLWFLNFEHENRFYSEVWIQGHLCCRQRQGQEHLELHDDRFHTKALVMGYPRTLHVASLTAYLKSIGSFLVLWRPRWPCALGAPMWPFILYSAILQVLRACETLCGNNFSCRAKWDCMWNMVRTTFRCASDRPYCFHGQYLLFRFQTCMVPSWRVSSLAYAEKRKVLESWKLWAGR